MFLAALGWAQFREAGLREIAGRLEVTTEPLMPARVYLYRNGAPFRLSPVDAMLPLRVDLFYRERVWRRSPDPSTLEVTCNDISHFFLLKGKEGFELPAGKYRMDAYRGMFYAPVSVEFELKAGQTTSVKLPMKNWAGERAKEWLSSDDHIHLVRAPEDDALFLKWMDAEDLSVGNFLQLQRQMDAAAQYGFGPAAEAKQPSRSIRSGHESRSEFFGHVNLLGGREMIRPLSIGNTYANSPETFPYPYVLFGMGKKLGATVGFAHFDGSQKHSSLLMDMALGALDFVEVLQFGKLRTDDWYELLNAGFKVTGVAGSDFPVSVNNATKQKQWSRWLPLLGPERMLVRAKAGASAYEAWSAGVRRGEGFVTNGPIVELEVKNGKAHASAQFFRAIDRLEIVRNGVVIGQARGAEKLQVDADVAPGGPAWIAARASVSSDTPDNAELQAHTNAVYLGWNGQAPSPEARASLARKWNAELEYYRSGPLVFRSEQDRRTFFENAEKAAMILQRTN